MIYTLVFLAPKLVLYVHNCVAYKTNISVPEYWVCVNKNCGCEILSAGDYVEYSLLFMCLVNSDIAPRSSIHRLQLWWINLCLSVRRRSWLSIFMYYVDWCYGLFNRLVIAMSIYVISSHKFTIVSMQIAV